MSTGIWIFMHAERLQESGDNYTARNPSSGASGAYQFTWGTWLYALGLAGLRKPPYNGESANHAPKSVQDAAAHALMSKYFYEFGHSWYNVAEAWYGGPGAVGHPNWGGGPGYPTVGEYATEVINTYRSLGGTANTGTSGGGGGTPGYSDLALIKHFEWANHLLNHALPQNLNAIRGARHL